MYSTTTPSAAHLRISRPSPPGAAHLPLLRQCRRHIAPSQRSSRALTAEVAATWHVAAFVGSYQNTSDVQHHTKCSPPATVASVPMPYRSIAAIKSRSDRRGGGCVAPCCSASSLGRKVWPFDKCGKHTRAAFATSYLLSKHISCTAPPHQAQPTCASHVHHLQAQPTCHCCVSADIIVLHRSDQVAL
jgi:hypothetical protein